VLYQDGGYSYKGSFLRDNTLEKFGKKKIKESFTYTRGLLTILGDLHLIYYEKLQETKDSSSKMLMLIQASPKIRSPTKWIPPGE